ncbi:MAG: elongation factor P maturation arginine rhamnosyltransferase EarP [Burkholderiales bacterium]
MPVRWDIFCSVVDHYGDAGVCWRLARQLAAEHGFTPRLWIDRPETLARLAPAIDPAQREQQVEGVEIRRWETAFAPAEPAQVVIETFGCELPPAYVEAMAAAPAPPAWINLDYLSAEAWVESCHGLLSPHPRLPLVKHFFFPGFTPRTGGVLVERDLAAARTAFQAEPQDRAAFWRALDAAPAADALAVSLFCYDTAPLAALLDAWADSRTPVACCVPAGVATRALEAWFRTPLVAGRPLRARALTLHPIPFLDQPGYDRLLWACDVNCVRGEDSFVRAQLAARPFAWNIYPQAADAHRVKLEAFLTRYTAGLAPAPAAALHGFMQAWNGAGDVAAAWRAFAAAHPALTAHAADWAGRLAAGPGLAASLVRFVKDRLQSPSF